MKIKRFNESIRDHMTPKSEEDILSAYKKMSPHGLQYALGDLELSLSKELEEKLRKQSDDGIKEAEKELDEILEMYGEVNEKAETKKLIQSLSEWIVKYGGPKENLTYLNGINSLTNVLEEAFEYSHAHDWEAIYSHDTVHKFHDFLKQLAYDFISYQNKDFPEY